MAALIALVAIASSATAFTDLVSIQGKLTNSNSQALTGDYSFKFEIYDTNAASRIPLWAETRTLSVNKGVFNAVLGDANTSTPITTVDFNRQRWLGIYVNGELQSPLIRMASQNSAFIAKTALDVNSPDFNQAWYSQIDANTIFWKQTDLNRILQVSDFNRVYVSWRDGNQQYVRQIDGNAIYWKQTDLNAILQVSDFNKVYYSQKDLNNNNLFIKITDTNNASRIAYGAIADLNKGYYAQSDANRVFWKQTDLNAAIQVLDFNRVWFSQLDANNVFLKLTGGTMTGDLNIQKDLNAYLIQGRGFRSTNARDHVLGTDSVSIGYDTNATGNNAIAIGYRVGATGAGSIAIGNSLTGTALSSGTGTILMGANAGTAISNGNGSILMGRCEILATCKSSNYGSILMGYFEGDANASSEGSTIMGHNLQGTIIASGNGSIVLGRTNIGTTEANGNGSFIAGNNERGTMLSSGSGSIVLGYTDVSATMQATGIGSVALGYNSQALQNYSTAIGWNAWSARANLVTLSQDVNIAGFLTVGGGKDANVGLNTGDLNMSGHLYVDKNIQSHGFLTVGNGKDMNGGLSPGDVNIARNLYVQGDANFNNLQVKGVQFDAGNAVISGDLNVAKDTNLANVYLQKNKSIYYRGKSGDANLSWIGDINSLALQTGGTAYWDYPGYSSAFVIDDNVTVSNAARNAFSAWITTQKTQSSSGTLYAFIGGYRDAGNNAPNVLSATAAQGYNYLEGTNARTIASLYAGSFINETDGNNITITDAYGVMGQAIWNASTSPTVQNAYALFARNPYNTTTIVNNYGLYVDRIAGGTTKNYAITTVGGDLNFDDGTVFVKRDLNIKGDVNVQEYVTVGRGAAMQTGLGTGDVNIARNLYVQGDANFNNLQVKGVQFDAGNLRVSGDLNVARDANIQGFATIGNSTGMHIGLQSGDVNISRNLYVDTNIMIKRGHFFNGETKQLEINPSGLGDGLMDVAATPPNKNMQFGTGAINFMGTYPLKGYATTETRGASPGTTAKQTFQLNPDKGNFWLNSDINIAGDFNALGFATIGAGTGKHIGLQAGDLNVGSKLYVQSTSQTKDVNAWGDINGYKVQGRQFASTSARVHTLGANAVAFGLDVNATGPQSFAQGKNTGDSFGATGTGSVIMGANEGSGSIMHSQGTAATVIGYNSASVGSAIMRATNTGSMSFGYNAAISGNTMISSSGFGSIAAGAVVGVSGDANIIASNTGAIAMGYSGGTSGTSEIKATNSGSIALGYSYGGKLLSAGMGSIALGFNSQALQNYSTAIGWNAWSARANLVTLSQDVNIAGFLTVGGGKDANVGLNTGDLNMSGNLYVDKNITSHGFLLLGNKVDMNAGLTVGDANISGKMRLQNDLNVSQGINKGVSIVSDTNRICFPGNRCDAWIDWNGTAIVISAPV